MNCKEGELSLTWWKQSLLGTGVETATGTWRAFSAEAAGTLPRARAKAAQAGHKVAREWVLSAAKSKPGQLHRWANENTKKLHYEVSALEVPALERAQPWRILEEKAKPWKET
eukprot:4595547-Heterocapsa_arctica.AAC.1